MGVVLEGDVELVGLGAGVHLVEGVLQHAHLPHVLGRVRLVQHELHAELVVLRRGGREDTYSIETCQPWFWQAGKWLDITL